MKYKILTISILTLFIATSVFSQTRDHARFNKITKDYVINKDGSVDYTYHKELKLISTSSFDSDYGETFIIYNPKFQDLKINKSYTVRADGSIVNTPKNAFNPGLPFSCTDCERYNGFKEMIVTHTALEHQATIVLDYTIHTQAEFIKEFMEVIDFMEYCPVTEYVVSVAVPDDIKLNYNLLNASVEPKTTEKEGQTVYTWKLEEVKQSSAESYLQSSKEIYPSLVLSTFKDMQRAIFAFVNQEAFQNYSLPECKNVLADITNDTLPKIDNILAIRDYVTDNVHTNDINIKHNNYVLSSASTTWKSNCGNKAEKAILLTAMLNEAGFQAVPISFVNEAVFNSNVACLDMMNHFAVRVFVDNQSFIVYPDGDLKNSLETLFNEFPFYVLDAFAERVQIQKGNPIDRKIELKGNYSFDLEGKAKGDISCLINSKYIPYFNLLKDEKQAVSSISKLNGKSTDVNFTREKLQFKLDVEKVNLSKIGTGYFAFELPETNLGLSVNPAYLPTKRIENVNCGKTAESYSFTISLPEGSTLVSKAVDMKIEKPFGKMVVKITNDGKGTLTVVRELNITQDVITPADYADFRKMMVMWNDEIGKKIVFKK